MSNIKVTLLQEAPVVFKPFSINIEFRSQTEFDEFYKDLQDNEGGSLLWESFCDTLVEIDRHGVK